MTLQTMLIHHNNNTVAHLQRQDFPSAVISSTTTMRLLQELQTMKSPQMFSSSGSFDCVDEYMLLTADIFATQTGPRCDATPFIYEHGIAIPSTAVPFEVIYSILIFNSALSHQLLAQEQQDHATRQRYLLKAKTLYELACKASRDVVDNNVLFHFAVMNNTAAIEQQTGNRSLSERYFEHLMSIFMLLVDGDCTSRLHLLRGFLRNVPVQVKAASAA